MSIINLCSHLGWCSSDKWLDRLNTGRKDIAGQRSEQHKGAKHFVKTARDPFWIQTILTNGEMAQRPLTHCSESLPLIQTSHHHFIKSAASCSGLVTSAFAIALTLFSELAQIFTTCKNHSTWPILSVSLCVKVGMVPFGSKAPCWKSWSREWECWTAQAQGVLIWGKTCFWVVVLKDLKYCNPKAKIDRKSVSRRVRITQQWSN